MNNTDVPIWEKYTLTIEEASKYFRIGEKKLRKLAECKCQYKNDQKVENKNVHFPRSIPQFVFP